ncbi:Isoamylase 2 [Nymphaea thermarum]|nr:Isoamylase 2 [Nymphaea thermarum]
MPFERKNSYLFALNLSFDLKKAPFYLSFLLHGQRNASIKESWIRNHLRQNFCVPVGIGRGFPEPLGATFCDDGATNFALFSRNAENVVLCLYEKKTSEPSLEIELDPYVNRTSDIWHASIENADRYSCYGYRCKGTTLCDSDSRFHVPRVLLDPYAKIISNLNSGKGESVSLVSCLGSFQRDVPFDWDGDSHPCTPMEEMVVYRLNVQRFTEDISSELPSAVAGTFFGVVEKLDHFKKLGVNAVLLEPIFPFIEEYGPYFPYHFFSPMNSYGPLGDGTSSSNSMKAMVKALHENKIEVLLEVIFTQTGEGRDSTSQATSFSGIDNSSYYIVERNPKSEAVRRLNCNTPVVQRMLLILFDILVLKTVFVSQIMDSLRHWVNDYHIDGFVFVDAASLIEGPSVGLLTRSPLIEAISFDPVLSKTKLIADGFSPVEALHKIHNFLFILYVSLGVPIVNMGDEYGQSTGGSPLYISRYSVCIFFFHFLL